MSNGTTILLNSTDTYLLARKLARLEQPDDMQPSPGVALLLNSYDTDKPDEFRRLNDVLRTGGVLQQIVAIDPKTPPSHEKPSEPEIYIPPLPDYAQLPDTALKAAENVGTWYKEASQWAAKRSPMTPFHFLQSGVIWAIGLAVARRVSLELHEQIYPHLYLLLVAETSKYAKSTGMNTIYSLIAATMPHMLIPGNVTPEGMIEILSGEKPSNFEQLGETMKTLINTGRRYCGQRGILMDEYSTLLGSSKKDYMAGFVELLMRLYDARDSEQYYTRSGGLLSVKKPGISIFGATTPAAMARALPVEDWENGAMARYLVMFREQPLPYNPNYIRFLPPKELLQPLLKLHNALPDMFNEFYEETEFNGYRASMTDGALKLYQNYMKAVFYEMIDDDLDERLHGNYRRLHIQAVKIALALACIDWVENNEGIQIVITEGHFTLAQQLTETSRESLHKLMPILSESRDARTQRDLISILKHAPPGGLTTRDICKQTGKSIKDIRTGLEVLIESGFVETRDHRPSVGRPTILYKWSSDRHN